LLASVVPRRDQQDRILIASLGVLTRTLAIAAAGLPWAPMWNIPLLQQPPAVYPAPQRHSPGVEALFYEGEPYRGHATRIFAWYGEPPESAGAKVPAMVLVHGGGGTAFAEWVRLWNSRDYAALAMDTCGALGDFPPERPGAPDRERHAHSGPPGWGGFEQMAEPVSDH